MSNPLYGPPEATEDDYPDEPQVSETRCKSTHDPTCRCKHSQTVHTQPGGACGAVSFTGKGEVRFCRCIGFRPIAPASTPSPTQPRGAK